MRRTAPNAPTPGWFATLRAERKQAGIDQYRGGDDSIPFQGDPLAEMLHELADCCNYLEAEVAGSYGMSPAQRGDWPAPFRGLFEGFCDTAEFVRRLKLSRDARRNGGIAWECGGDAEPPA